MKDTIYRADAIEAVNKEIYHSQTDRKTVVAVLSALPSAEAVSREVYEKRTQADERIIDSYRREFSEAASAEAVQGEWSATKSDVCGVDTCGADMKGEEHEHDK